MEINKNIAVLGCGYWGRNLVRNFQALGALRMVCDPAEEGRKTARGIAPEAEISASFDEALNHKSVAAVVISAPAAHHYTLTKKALLAGKDVYVEKPLCLALDEAQELVALADRLGHILMVGHLLQYHPCVEALHSLIGKGALGKLH